MKDVFISYASEDRPLAQRLGKGLEQSGVSVWWDRQIEVGSEWDKTIEDELAAAKCVVVLWTGHAKNSRWVRAEAREALKHEKILPVMLEPNAIPLAFTGIQALRFHGWDGTADSMEFKILLSVVHGKLEGKAIELPAGTATEASWVGKIAALVGLKTGIGALVCLFLIASSFVRVPPVVSVHVETTRMEFRVVPGVEDKRLTDPLPFDTLTVQGVGKLSLSPDRLLVADPVDYDMTSDSYPPKAWLDLPNSGSTVQFKSKPSEMESEITIEPTDHQDGTGGLLDGLVLTHDTVVTMEVGKDNAVTWSIRKKEGLLRVVVSGIHAVQFIQSGLTGQPELTIPFSEDQELTYQAIFERRPGMMELVGKGESLVLVLKNKGPETKTLMTSSVLPVQAVDFSRQDSGTGERKTPEGFEGRVEYRSPQGMPSVVIEKNWFLALGQLEHFEITSVTVDLDSHILVANLQGKAGYLKTGTPQNPQDLRPTLFDHIRFNPLFEPIRKIIGF